MQNVRWVWLDIGATLASEEACVAERCRALAEDLRAHGVYTTRDELVRLQEEAATAFHPRPLLGALDALHVPPTVRDQVAMSGRWPRELECPYPGALDAVRCLAERFSLGVVANQAAGSRDRLARYGFLPYLADALLSDELDIQKPDSRIFDLLLKRSAAPPERIVVVGDRLDNDVAPARSRGMKTVRVLQGVYRRQQSRSSDEQPDLTVPTIADVPAALFTAPW